jgi:hypothetical protein
MAKNSLLKSTYSHQPQPEFRVGPPQLRHVRSGRNRRLGEGQGGCLKVIKWRVRRGISIKIMVDMGSQGVFIYRNGRKMSEIGRY